MWRIMLHIVKTTTMTKKTSTSIFILLFSLAAYAQKLDYGVLLQYNMASHTNFNPEIPEDGRFQWDNLNTIGIGVYLKKQHKSRLQSEIGLLYQRKGYVEIAQTGIIGIPGGFFSENKLRNSLDYVSLTTKVNYIFLKRKNIQSYFTGGFEQNLLLKSNIESEDITLIQLSYPVDEYKDNWKRYTLNYIIGIGLPIQDKITLGLYYNRSISPVLKTNNLLVKDWIFFFKLDISIQNIFIGSSDNS